MIMIMATQQELQQEEQQVRGLFDPDIKDGDLRCVRGALTLHPAWAGTGSEFRQYSQIDATMR